MSAIGTMSKVSFASKQSDYGDDDDGCGGWESPFEIPHQLTVHVRRWFNDAGCDVEPEVTVPGADPQLLYTLAVWDHDAPYPTGDDRLGASSPYAHWIVVNAPGARFESERARTLVPFASFAPPAGSPPHCYVVNVFEQPGPVDPSTLREFEDQPRQRFPVNKLWRAIDPLAVGKETFRVPAHPPCRRR